MNDTNLSCLQDEEALKVQMDRIVEYEQKLLSEKLEPRLAAMFLLYLVISSSLLSLGVYWFFSN